MLAIKESNVTIMVKDMDIAVKFYEDLVNYKKSLG
ncbi:MAG: hypothetical protein JWN78_2654 [Bacteroidota bacterium]|nr:hypothetical protein [Bacteroidota bacterium]